MTVPVVGDKKQKAFMIWIDPDLHTAVWHKLKNDKLTATALLTHFLERYSGFKVVLNPAVNPPPVVNNETKS